MLVWEAEKMMFPKPTKIDKPRKRMRQSVDREMIAWANAVKERDNYECQRCHLEGNHAHHIVPRGRAPHLRLELSNGITCCQNCHSWIHANVAEATAAGFLSRELRDHGEPSPKQAG